MSDAFKMHPLYAMSMPVREKDEEDQAFSDRAKAYDALNNQNNLIIQNTLAEFQAKIAAIEEYLGG